MKHKKKRGKRNQSKIVGRTKWEGKSIDTNGWHAIQHGTIRPVRKLIPWGLNGAQAYLAENKGHYGTTFRFLHHILLTIWNAS